MASRIVQCNVNGGSSLSFFSILTLNPFLRSRYLARSLSTGSLFILPEIDSPFLRVGTGTVCCHCIVTM